MTPRLEAQILSYLASNPPGWCWPAKALALAESVLLHPVCRAVEVGVFGGRSLIPLALACRENDLMSVACGIDPWSSEEALRHMDPIADAAHIVWWGSQNLDAIYARAQADLAKLNLLGHCILLRTTGRVAHLLWGLGTIDVLHIDGNHSEEASASDVEMWLPLCRSGAHIMMDDTNWSSTQKALHLLEAKCEHLLTLPDAATGSEARLFRKLS